MPSAVSLQRLQGDVLTVSADALPSTQTGSATRFSPAPEWVKRTIVQQAGRPYPAAQKRALDLVVAGAALLLLAPLMLAIALAIKITSKGPALFVQSRLGKDGVPFPVFKFRTMAENADQNYHMERSLAHMRERNVGGAQFKNESDPRVTALGKVLRKTSIDELPQLFNVIRGEMSIVGPRPCLSYEYEMYDARHKNRVRVKPGLTGLMQVCGRASLTFEEMIELDLLYAEHPSFILDCAVIGRTPLTIVRGTGAC